MLKQTLPADPGQDSRKMERPSDIQGLIYIPFKDDLAKDAGVTLTSKSLTTSHTPGSSRGRLGPGLAPGHDRTRQQQRGNGEDATAMDETCLDGLYLLMTGWCNQPYGSTVGFHSRASR